MRFQHTIVLLSLLFCTYLQAQVGSIMGSLFDSAAKVKVQYAVIVLAKAKDSTLVTYTRSDVQGRFELKNLPLDTYKLMITHPQFAAINRYVLVTNKKSDFELDNLVLPPKSYQINEIVVYADKEPIFYRGDTLVYRADSFKVKENANVEDLLKKLPGMKVDAQGKITVQGQSVDQVLVDGDEFFGDDPTMATQNLSAKSINTLEVYDKKDVTSESAETTKVLNLTLKEDAKKGYFGKVEGGSDFSRFYEGTVLANKFSGKRKVSLYGLGSNTPKSGFDWQDLNNFGMSGNWSEGDDGNWTSNGDNDLFSWNGNKSGLPRNIKTGLNYNDQWGEHIKVYANYSYKNGLVKAREEEFSQFFLQGNTGYNTSEVSLLENLNTSHSANFSIAIELDSLSKLKISPNIKWTTSERDNSNTTEYLTSENELTRTNQIFNTKDNEAVGLSSKINYERKFKKKNRVFEGNLDLDYSNSTSEEFLLSRNVNSANANLPALADVDQKKEGRAKAFSQRIQFTWVEPITAKFKIKGAYTYSNANSTNRRSTFNKTGDSYSIFDSIFSNDFENLKYFHEPGIDFIYETKKYTIALGSKYRNSLISSLNKVNNRAFEQTVNNIFPTLRANYNFSKSTRLSFNYRGSTRQPDINQLQPLPDNSNPNSIRTGNPNLKPSFSQSVRLNFNSYKGLSGTGFNSSLSYTTTNNQFINNTSFDSLNRTITRPENVNGAYNVNGNIGAYFTIKKINLSYGPSLSTSYSNQISLINSRQNFTRTLSIGPSMNVNFDNEKLNFDLNAELDYNQPSTTINAESNRPYTSQTYSLNAGLKLPKKIEISSSADYSINGRRADGFNVNVFILNATIEKKFLKTDNLILGIRAYDLLNQNTNINRTVSDNRISDSRNNIVQRYILGVLTFKFNSANGKSNDDDDY